MASRGEPAIRANGLGHRFGIAERSKQILFDIDLELRPGEIAIMTGPSGSGKTTLLTLIGGLRSVQHGSLKVLGTDMKGLAPRRLVELRRRVGFIFQAHNLFDSLTAQQNVRLGLELHDHEDHAMERAAVEALTRLGLGDHLHHRPHALSGGQRQRVAVARAIANRPKLILADEPTAALDKDSGRDVVELFRQLTRDENSTILLVTHDNRILDIADRIVTLLDGRIASDVDVKRTTEACRFLRDCRVFSDSSPHELTEVAQMMTFQEYPAGEVVVREGNEADKFYVIRSGTANVVSGHPGSERLLKRLQAGDFFGEIALLQDSVRTASVVATKDLQLFVLDRSGFRAAVDRSEGFEQQLLVAFSQRR